MKPLIIAAALLLAGPAFAAELEIQTVTAAQWKTIHKLYALGAKCWNADEPNNYCERWRKLETRLDKQGFCITSMHHPVGRTSKDGKDCNPLREP